MAVFSYESEGFKKKTCNSKLTALAYVPANLISILSTDARAILYSPLLETAHSL